MYICTYIDYVKQIKKIVYKTLSLLERIFASEFLSFNF